MLVSSFISITDAGIFIRRWWFLRKRLSRDWSLGARDGISQTEFLRLLVTVTTIIVIYLPISIMILILNLLVPRQQYSWERVHGLHWGVIIKLPRSTVGWDRWVGPFAAINLFSLMGITRTSKKLFELCIEWTYDHSPSVLQKKLLWMRNVSVKCKQARLAVANDAELGWR
jgi:Pheromone A receptor